MRTYLARTWVRQKEWECTKEIDVVPRLLCMKTPERRAMFSSLLFSSSTTGPAHQKREELKLGWSKGMRWERARQSYIEGTQERGSRENPGKTSIKSGKLSWSDTWNYNTHFDIYIFKYQIILRIVGLIPASPNNKILP